MKDQYFGDINDFRKFGLLRALTRGSSLRLLVAWMLTPNDDSTDGQKRAWLDDPTRWRAFDPPLFDGLASILGKSVQPNVSLIEQSDLLERACFDRALVPDGRDDRIAWYERLGSTIEHDNPDLVFLDPDNGIEVPSVPLGAKNSSRYAYWTEIERVWSSGCSVLIYQHYPHEKRSVFIKRIHDELALRTGSPLVRAFHTSHTLLLLAAQARHARTLSRAIDTHLRSWVGQIDQQQTTRIDNTIVSMTTHEPIVSRNAPEPVGPYPHARRVGDLVFVSGLGPRQRGSATIPGVTLDEAGHAIAHDIQAQCHSVFANLKAVLDEAGSSFDRIVDVLVFLTDMKGDFQAFNRVYGEYFAGEGKPNPTRTTVEITALPTPIAIELKVIATI